MTYPPPRYHGDGGQVSASHRPADRPPDHAYANGTTVHYLATAASTDGLFGLYRWEMGPAPSGPEPHFHRTIAESFYVLSGTVRIYDGAAWTDAVAGTFVHVPPGGIHAFRNESGAPATMLIHFAPGAPREAYFEGLPELRDASPEERAAFVASHDQFPARAQP
jgi:mannose-6-phosphate isomerase-like protein (cupin superfamily)